MIISLLKDLSKSELNLLHTILNSRGRTVITSLIAGEVKLVNNIEKTYEDKILLKLEVQRSRNYPLTEEQIRKLETTKKVFTGKNSNGKGSITNKESIEWIRNLVLVVESFLNRREIKFIDNSVTVNTASVRKLFGQTLTEINLSPTKFIEKVLDDIVVVPDYSLTEMREVLEVMDENKNNITPVFPTPLDANNFFFSCGTNYEYLDSQIADRETSDDINVLNSMVINSNIDKEQVKSIIKSLYKRASILDNLYKPELEEDIKKFNLVQYHNNYTVMLKNILLLVKPEESTKLVSIKIEDMYMLYRMGVDQCI